MAKMKRFVALGLTVLALLCAGPGVARASAALVPDPDEVLEALLAEQTARQAQRGADARPEAAAAAVPEALFTQEETWLASVPDGALAVGMYQPLTGCFSLDLWGGSAADADVRALLHAYSPVTADGPAYVLDPQVVYGFSSATYEDGNQVFVVSIQDDLRYSDGTPVRARDYIFSMLLRASPVIAELGGVPEGCDAVVGMGAYKAGTSDALAGVRLLDAFSFSIEIDAAYADSLYAMSSLDVVPCPIDLLAPGCDVVDDGWGARVVEAAGLSVSTYSAQMLGRALLDPDSGYLSNPSVSTGPYRLARYDSGAGTVRLVRNTHYKGTDSVAQPSIDEIWLGPAPAGAMDALARGEIDLLRGLDEGAAVEAGIQLASSGRATLLPYGRQGLGYLLFDCADGPAASAAVRRAVALCMDLQKICNAYSPYAVVPSGQAGRGHWVCEALNDVQESVAEDVLQAYAALVPAGQDIAGAQRLLEAEGWSLSEAGEPFAQGTHAVRYRQTDAGLTPLTLRLAVADSPLASAVGEALPQAAALAGMQIEVVTLAADALDTQEAVCEVLEAYDIILLAEDAPASIHVLRRMLDMTGVEDKPLNALIETLKETTVSSMTGYYGRWVQVQVRWMQVMPSVPLLTGLRFDLHAPALQGYELGTEADWAQAVAAATLAY